MSSESAFFESLRGAEAIKPTAPSEDSIPEMAIKEGDPDVGKPVTIRTLFTHHDTHPVVLDLSLMRQFGLDWLSWDIATVWSEIKTEFKTEISELSRAKIQTVKTCHVSAMPWTKWQVFEKVMQGLNNNIPTFELMQAPTLEQLYAGVDILATIRKVEFSDEVKLYMASSVQLEEITFVPPPLDFIQQEVARPHYRCNDCGNVESALFHDGSCTVCTNKVSPEKGASLLPDLDAKVGRSLDSAYMYPYEHILARWNEVHTKPTASVDFKETEEDIQIAKLMLARDYMNVRRRQLADQLTSLKSWLGAS
jgi:hypothetical protein